MALNGISTATIGSPVVDPVATKLWRRDAKLTLAAEKRSTVGIPGYRVLNVIDGTHPAYVSGVLTTESGTASPEVGHPWSLVPAPIILLSLEDGSGVLGLENGDILGF